MGATCCSKCPERKTESDLEEQVESSDCTDISSNKIKRNSSPLLTNVQQLYYFQTHETKDKGRVTPKARPRETQKSMREEVKRKPFSENPYESLFCRAVCSGKSRAQEVCACRMIENKREERKTPDSIKSTGRIIKPFSPFDLGPSNFRCENTGRIEDHYTFISAIGKGSFGVVKLAKDKVTGEKRAVKIIVKAKFQAAEHLSEEILILRKLVNTTPNKKER